MATEAAITRAAVDMIKKLGIYARPIKIVGSDGQEAGVSDIIVCAGGRFIAIEMKKPDLKHKLSALQCLFLDSIEASGGYASVCCTPEDAADAVLRGSTGYASEWRRSADIRAFPGKDRTFPSFTC